MGVNPEIFEQVKKAVELLTQQTDSGFSLKKIEGKGWAVYTTGKLIRIDIRVDDDEGDNEIG